MKEEIYLTQEDLKKFSEAFESFYKKEGGCYPKNYYDYWIGWEYRGKFYIGMAEDGDRFVELSDAAVWNFPIVKRDDYPNLILKLEEEI